jgi:hypothetical protein
MAKELKSSSTFKRRPVRQPDPFEFVASKDTLPDVDLSGPDYRLEALAKRELFEARQGFPIYHHFIVRPTDPPRRVFTFNDTGPILKMIREASTTTTRTLVVPIQKGDPKTTKVETFS